MSTATMNSSPSSAASSRPPFGVDSTGLPARQTKARTWPSPGVSISSAMQTTGSSPSDSGIPDPAVAAPEAHITLVAGRALGVGGTDRGPRNMAPPGRSRLPVQALSTSTSQLVTCRTRRWSCRCGRTRRAGRGQLPGSRRMVFASTPVASATSSGANGARAGRPGRAPDVGHGRPGRRGPRRAACGPSRPAAGRRYRAAPRPTRRPPRRSGCAAGRRPPAGRRPQRLDPAGPVRRGGQAAVRGVGVGAEDEEVVGPVDVGHRDDQTRTEHHPGGDLLGPLVDRAGRVHVRRAQRPDERAGVQLPGQGVAFGLPR